MIVEEPKQVASGEDSNTNNNKIETQFEIINPKLVNETDTPFWSNCYVRILFKGQKNYLYLSKKPPKLKESIQRIMSYQKSKK